VDAAKVSASMSCQQLGAEAAARSVAMVAAASVNVGVAASDSAA
jgi:hypothetical protein